MQHLHDAAPMPTVQASPAPGKCQRPVAFGASAGRRAFVLVRGRPVALRRCASFWRSMSQSAALMDVEVVLDQHDGVARVEQRVQLALDGRHRLQEFMRGLDRHLEDLRDVLALVLDFERLAVVALAVPTRSRCRPSWFRFGAPYLTHAGKGAFMAVPHQQSGRCRGAKNRTHWNKKCGGIARNFATSIEPEQNTA
ncbi:hypothetical protein N8A90_16420 [Variovorax sp. N23]|nr:hypothetical protein [Variovorax sp. N23]